MSVWTINGQSPESLGLTVVSGTLRAAMTSSMRLARAADFDATQPFAFGDSVTLAKDGAPIFQGKAVPPMTRADGSSESQTIEIRDAWDDLETTVYQEEWGTGTDPMLLPRAVLGLGLIPGEEPGSFMWSRITVGAQIREVINFAIDNGVDIQLGSVPTGETMIPSEVENMTCAEVLQQCLKLHPDWIPHLDHTTTPPTFHVTAAGTATGATFSLEGMPTESWNIRHRTDMLPDGVRVIYELATEIDGEVYRHVVEDKYPPTCPDAGPRTILATIPLAGLQMQTQKEQIKTRTLPTGPGTDAEAYLKKKFPALKDVDGDHFAVFEWSLALAETEPDPDPINPRAARPEVTNVSEVPRELVEGRIAEWMRKKSARVTISMRCGASPDATEAERKLIAGLPQRFTVVATNAVTKIYKGISQWVAAEDVPTGIAQATYQAILAAMSYEGEITITDDEINGTSYAGRAVGLTGGDEAWVGMKAPVHSVDWDVQNGSITVGFGPNPYLSPADFLELQRILRFRPTKWWSTDERGSRQHGSESNPSAAGDSANGGSGPEHSPTWLASPLEQFEVHSLGETGGDWQVKVKAGSVLAIDPAGATVMNYLTADGVTLDVSASHKIWVKVETSKQDLATAATIISQTTAPTDQHAQPDPGGQTGIYHYLLADFETVGGVLEVKTRYHQGGPLIHRPARNDRNLDLGIQAWVETTGKLDPDTSYSGPNLLYFRQGLFVGSGTGDAGAADVIVSVITGSS